MNYLDFAIQMELDGEKYYREQAEKNKGTALYTIFTLLAKDEKFHAETLRKKADKLPYELTDKNALSEYENVFKNMDDFKQSIKASPDQIDAYRMALEKEKESIELYEKMISQANDSQSEELFKYLITQEKSHYKIFDELVHHLRHAHEWIESAEIRHTEKY